MLNAGGLLFQNLHSMADPAFRKYLLHKACQVSDVRVFAETGCTNAEEERRWAQDCQGCSHVFWASAPESQTGKKVHNGRGMAVFVSKRVPFKDARVFRDPSGRYIIVRCRIHNRESLLIGMHADNHTDAEQAAYYDRVLARLLAEGLDED